MQFNEGCGEPYEVEENGKKIIKFTRIEHIRSLLFKTMEEEVAIFCSRRLDAERCHQQVYYQATRCCVCNECSQLIYDSAAASFKFLSLRPDKIPDEQRKKFKDLRIKIPIESEIL